MFTLKELKAIQYSDLIWVEESKSEEDDAPFVEQYYHLMAALLNAEYLKTGNWKDVVAMYNSNGLNVTFKNMQKLILEDGLFTEIAAEYDEKSA